MVKVPDAFSQGFGQQSLRPVSGARVSVSTTADAFGARQGRQLQQAGQALGQASQTFLRIEQEEQKAKGYDVYSEMSRQSRELLNNPDAGIYSRKGSQALGAYKDANKALDEIYTKNTEGLEEGALQRVNELWRNKRENMLDGVSRFEIKERNAYKRQAADSSLATYVADSAENYNNPQYIQDSITDGNKIIMDSMAGAPPEAVKLKMQEFQGKIHDGVINRMLLEGDALGAKEYFEQVEDDLNGKQQLVYTKMIQESEERATAQTAANQIYRTQESYEEQLESAGQIQDKKLRSEVTDILDQRHSQEVQVSEQRRLELSQNAWDTVIETGDKNSIPIQQWVALDDETKSQIRRYTKRSGDAKTDPRVWAEAYTMYEQDPESFKKLNLNNMVNDISPSEYRDLVKKQQAVIKGEQEEQSRTRTDNAIAKNRLAAIGIDPNPKAGTDEKKEDALKAAQFFRAMNLKKAQFVKANGRDPNEEEIESIIDGLVVNLVFDDADKGYFFDTDIEKFAFELTGDENPQDVVVPDDARTKILNDYYQELGTKAPTPSEEDIRRAYVSQVGAF